MWINFESAIRGNLTSAKSVKINPKKKKEKIIIIIKTIKKIILHGKIFLVLIDFLES